MRYVEDKGCYNQGVAQETPNNSTAMYSEFHKGKDITTTTTTSSNVVVVATAATPSRVSNHHRIAMGKPTPSKWDDAQKWLVGLSKGGEKSKSNQSKSKPRNSNADDLRLIAPVPQKEQDYSSSDEKEEENQDDEEEHTKKVECDESIWRNKALENTIHVQSICFRDMGTEMTPIASQEPSRTATPIRATTPNTRSPIHSGTSTPMRGQNGLEMEPHEKGSSSLSLSNRQQQCGGQGSSPCNIPEKNNKIEDNYQARKLSPLESRAVAWDEAERAKYMARFKREEMKIQAWESHQIRKAEMEMKKMEVKAERMKALAQERLTNKLASTRRIAEEKRANAQDKLNEKALRTTERVEYIRRTGHVPSSFSFSFKLPSICW